ncbi:thioredoxin domain-containing protein [Candidatus Saccharibacteria bacterium]|nr:thioredoxin domain-containing protein [Candidatus Saccharibacteria bacterium]MCB9821058.1 thioredoxin domain-containing protein [Candidatus Nomurabacteria bacterium]
MNFKLAGIIIAVLVAIIGIGVLSGGSGNNDGPNVADAEQVNSEGLATSKVVFTEAGDFECPACASFHTLIKQVASVYQDRVKFEFIHFPLKTIHPNSLAAHRAAQSAALQGKFWEMHDLLFEQRDLWISTTTSNPVLVFESFASQLGLDMDKFRLDFSSTEVNDYIQANIDLGTEMGVEATPSFFLNGQKLDNTQIDSVEKISKLLDQELAQTSDSTPSTADAKQSQTDSSQTN